MARRGVVGGDAIRIDGLRELSKSLRLVEDGLQKEITGVFKRAAEKVADEARRRVPVRSGRLRDSIRPYATQRAAGVRMGKARVPYAGPVEFGGYPKARPFVAEGRYIYPAFTSMIPQVRRQVEDELADLVRQAGLAPEFGSTMADNPGARARAAASTGSGTSAQIGGWR